MREGQGFLLVYSIVDSGSFEEVEVMREKIVRTKDSEDIPIVLCGNKCDLEKRRHVKREDAQELADTVGASHFDTSAKQNKGLKEALSS